MCLSDNLWIKKCSESNGTILPSRTMRLINRASPALQKVSAFLSVKQNIMHSKMSTMLQAAANPKMIYHDLYIDFSKIKNKWGHLRRPLWVLCGQVQLHGTHTITEYIPLRCYLRIAAMREMQVQCRILGAGISSDSPLPSFIRCFQRAV